MKGEWVASLERTRQLRLKVKWAGLRLKWWWAGRDRLGEVEEARGLAGKSWPGLLMVSVAEIRKISAC
jgi:hypothetical protein